MFVEGDDKPKVMYTPYIYATVSDFSTFYKVDYGKHVEIIKKEDK